MMVKKLVRCRAEIETRTESVDLLQRGMGDQEECEVLLVLMMAMKKRKEGRNEIRRGNIHRPEAGKHAVGQEAGPTGRAS